MDIRTLTCICVLLSLALCDAASGQSELLDGADSSLDVRVGVYGSNASGNQDWVREYDGRSFHVPGIELLDLLGYNRTLHYFFAARDLLLGNEEAAAQFMLANRWRFDLTTSALLHRLERTPASDPSLVGTPAEGGNNFLDLSPGTKFVIDRREDRFSVGYTPGRNSGYRLIASYWDEIEKGRYQLLFRARQAAPGVIANRQRGGVAVPVDRRTGEAAFGGDARLGDNVVLNYRFENTKFGEGAGRAAFDFLPLNSLTRIHTDTKRHVAKVRAKLGDRLHLTGSQVERKRENRSSTLLSPNIVKTSGTNAALTYLVGDHLTLTGRYRAFELKSCLNLLFDEEGELQNQLVCRDEDSLELEATYTGIRRAFMRLSYENRDIDREITPPHSPHPEFEHPRTSASSDTDILRFGFRYYPGMRLNFSGLLEWWDTDTPGYPSIPTDRTRVNLNATYMVRDNIAFYGDFSRWDEENEIIRVPIDQIPTPATDAEDEELRGISGGQNYRNRFTTTNVGLWYGLNARWTVDLNLGWVNTDSAVLWVVGLDPAFLPHLLPDDVPYEARNQQWSLGSTYAVTPKSRIYGRFTESRSRGKQLIDPSIFPEGIGPTWQPVNAKGRTYTLGFGQDLTLRDTLLLDFSTSRWDDSVVGANNGKFHLMRLAWQREF